ncbi:MAG: helicase [Planctomycetota bacterium]|nr:MAG: helicase [Planctomycetota bacterium]
MKLLEDIFKQDGTLSKNLSTYEFRPEQLEMANEVFDAMLDKEHLVVEAGTGIGKSFGYLIPAILSIDKTNDPIVISTNTINLQEQLINKDLPFIRRFLGIPFIYKLGKGRNNFISIRRMQIALEKHTTLFEDAEQFHELSEIYQWSKVTKDGSKSSLVTRPSPAVWSEVQSDKDNCLGKRCPFYSKCFYFQSRLALQKANIIVVNHALLFTDLQLKPMNKGILPKYQKLVIDEAHKVEPVASEHFGITVSRRGFQILFSKILNPSKNKGFFANHEFRHAIEDLMIKMPEFLDEFYGDIFTYFNSQTKFNEKILRIRESGFVDTTALTHLRDLYDKLKEALAICQDDNEEVQINSFMESIVTLSQSLTFILFREGNEEYVYWIQLSGKSNHNITLNAAPIDIANQLNNLLFKNVNSVTLTSATLIINNTKNGFDYFNKRVGLQESRTLQAGSPFDYQKNVSIHIPLRIDAPNTDNYDSQMIECVRYYVHATQGGAFILFTSYSALQKAFLALQHEFKKAGYQIQCQGNNQSRSQMLDDFKESNNSVLFGTDSFWEGVDVQGEKLRNVIITKLPFSVPTHPVNQAKYELIENQGKNSFKELSLPQAVLKFKQGFGRLIRSKEDKGIVCILDTRIINKFYGMQFLSAIPKCEIIRDEILYN